MDLSDRLKEFTDDGVTIIEDVFTDDEVDALRKGMHDELAKHDIDHYKILNGEEEIV